MQMATSPSSPPALPTAPALVLLPNPAHWLQGGQQQHRAAWPSWCSTAHKPTVRHVLDGGACEGNLGRAAIWEGRGPRGPVSPEGGVGGALEPVTLAMQSPLKQVLHTFLTSMAPPQAWPNPEGTRPQSNNHGNLENYA